MSERVTMWFMEKVNHKVSDGTKSGFQRNILSSYAEMAGIKESLFHQRTNLVLSKIFLESLGTL